MDTTSELVVDIAKVLNEQVEQEQLNVLRAAVELTIRESGWGDRMDTLMWWQDLLHLVQVLRAYQKAKTP